MLNNQLKINKYKMLRFHDKDWIEIIVLNIKIQINKNEEIIIRNIKGDSKVSTPFCKSTLFIGIYIYRVDRNIQFCREWEELLSSEKKSLKLCHGHERLWSFYSRWLSILHITFLQQKDMLVTPETKHRFLIIFMSFHRVRRALQEYEC